MKFASAAEILSSFQGNEEAIKIISQTPKCLVSHSHFELASGMHSTDYVNKDALFQNQANFEKLCELQLDHLHESVDLSGIDGFIGPERFGSRIVAIFQDLFPLKFGGNCHAFSVKKSLEGKLAISPEEGAKLQNRRLIAVDDVLTTGGSLREIVRQVEESGGEVLQVSVMIDRGFSRGNDRSDPIYYAFSLVQTALPVWKQSSCPLCQNNVPLNPEFGHSQANLANESERQPTSLS